MQTLAPRRDAPEARLYGQPDPLWLLLILAVTALAFGSCSSSDNNASPPATSTLAPSASGGSVVSFRSANGKTATLTVEIADTAEERSRGLMSRPSLAEDAGMLFVFQEDTETPFYMKDTLVPLSIAFIDASGTIVDIQDMQPQTTDLHYSAKPYRYSVEANQGWYARNGIAVGDKASWPGPPKP